MTAPVWLDAVVARAMVKRPEDRYDTAAEFAAALHPPAVSPAYQADETLVIAANPVAPRPPPSPAVPKGGSKLPLIVAGGVAAALIVAGVTWLVLPGTPPPMQQASLVPAPPAPSRAAPAPLANPAPATVTTPSEPPPSPAAPSQASNAPPPVPYVAPLLPAPVLPPPSPVVAPSPPVSPPPPAPFQAASTPPQPEPVPASHPEPSPTRPVALIEASLAASLPAVKCSLARGSVAADGSVTLNGLTGAGQPEDALRRAAAAAGSTTVDWRMRSFNGPYCPALDLLRPVVDFAARNRNAMEMVQSGGPVALQDNDVISLQVTMPGFAGFLHVEYLQNDGTVSPQVPGPGYPEQTYAARRQIELGKPRQDFEGWHVGPPFGTDMIVAVASTAPLFAKALPDSQPLSAYLSALQAAIDALRRRGGSVVAAAVVLDTRRTP